MGADGEVGEPAGRSGLSKRARGAIIVAVFIALVVGGIVVGQRRRDDYDHAMTRVQVEAQAVGGTVDVGAFVQAWAKETTGEWSGDETRPAQALVPAVAGAKAVNYFAGANPPQAVIDYQVDAGGQEGCVRLVRTADATTVVTNHDVCARSFLGAS